MAARRWSARDDDRLVDLFYDAALDDALWPKLLEEVGDRVGAHPGNFVQLSTIDGHGFGLATRTPEDIMARYFAEWAHLNPIALAEDPAAYPVGWTPRITRDSDSVDRRLLERSAFWNEFLVPIGAYHLVILRLALRGNDVTTVTLGRPNHRGAFEDDEIAVLRPLHRHLVRAERIWRSLGVRQAEFDQFDTLLAAVPHPLFFVDDGLRALRWTAAAEALLGRSGTLRVTSGRLRALDPAGDSVLQGAMATALLGGTPPPVTLSGPRPGDGLVVSIARLGSRALAGVTGARCLLVSARPLAAHDPAGVLRTSYSLTAAEADLALAIGEGHNLRAISARRGVSFHTVRTQLKAVFDKTGCHRQAELVRLLTNPPGR